jgi:N-acylneuraminate cytidylyltransferase/CMP-N,N'-diacetyllegionaminic acid synthase
MINNKKIIAIITARSGSKGLKNKNILNLYGKPLVAWPIEAALQSKYIDRVLVSTDDKDIAAVSVTAGAEVPFLRDKNLAKDNTPSSDVIMNVLENIEKDKINYEYLILLEPTSPLTTSEDIDLAFEKLESNILKYDSMISDGVIEPISGKFPSDIPRRQDVRDTYFLDGSLYISKISTFLSKKSFYHKNTLPFIFPYWKSFEIDTYLDFVCIEAIMANIEKIKSMEQ